MAQAVEGLAWVFNAVHFPQIDPVEPLAHGPAGATFLPRNTWKEDVRSAGADVLDGALKSWVQEDLRHSDGTDAVRGFDTLQGRTIALASGSSGREKRD